jgi:hypothetical protein
MGISYMKQLFNNSFLKNKKGFALTQVLLAVALGAVVAAGVAYYYSRTAKDQLYTNLAAGIIGQTEVSQQENVTGNATTNNYSANGYNVSIANGIATVSNLDTSACSAIASQLKSKGQITSSCNNSNTSLNTITYSPLNTVLAQSKAQTFSAGTPENDVNSNVNNANLSGTFSVSGTSVAAGSTNSVFTNNGTTLTANPGLSGGANGGLSSGSTTSSTKVSPPSSSKGGTSLACSYYLTQPAYQTASLGTRATPCSAGYTSTSNQTGVVTYSCPNPNAATLPVATDTWSGGSCAIICVPAAPKYQNVACPSGEVGTEQQQAISTCPSYTGNPVYGPWTTISTSNCKSAVASYSNEIVCATIGVNIPAGCLSGSSGVWESPQIYTGGSFQVTITYGGVSQTVISYGGIVTANVGGGTFQVNANVGAINNCPAANPAFAGSCVDHVNGSVTQL